MSFKDCIATAIETGAVSAGKGADAQAAYDEAFTQALDEGMDEVRAADAATMQAVEAMTKLTADKRWQRINQLRTAHRNYQRFNSTTKYQRDVDSFMEELVAAQQRIIGQAQRFFVKNLEKYRPRAAGLWHSTDMQREAIDAVYGGNVGSPEARELAAEMLKVEDFLVDLANARGASIVKNPNRRLPQIHDRIKLHRAGEDKWVADHLQEGVLDWDVMEYEGKYIPQAQREQILRTVYQTIVNEGYNKLRPGQGRGRGSLATELSRERFLYYANADGWMRMNEAYGRGNVFQQFVGQIESMGMNIALLEKFGPNPDAGRAFIQHTMEKRAADLQIARGTGPDDKRTEKSKVDAAVVSFDDQFKIFSRRVLNGEENFAATTPSSIRTFIGSQVLNSAFLSAIGDFGFARHIAMVNRLPQVRHMSTYFRYMLPGNKNARQFAIRSGLIAESATTFASGYQRYFGPMLGNSVVRRLSDVQFRMNLLTPHTQASKWAWAHELMGTFADQRNVSWDNLPFAPLLTRHGISEAEWDMFRATQVFDDEGALFLRPTDMWDSGNARQKRVADKFQDMILMTMEQAVPTTNLRTMSAMGTGVDAGTWRGELLRTIGMIKTFAILPFTLYGRDMMMRSTTQGRLAYLASFMLWTTVFGAFITQIKAIATGNDPHDMRDPKFWLKSAINGGTFGLLGDLAVNGVGSLFGGPLPDTFDDVIGVGRETAAMAGGDQRANPLGNMIELGSDFIPMQNLWQVKLLMQRAFWDQVMKEADPAAYRRQLQWQRQQAKETGQQPFWPRGETMPVRGPNFGAAIGQQ